MLDNKYRYPNFDDFASRRPRILMIDSFSGQLATGVLKKVLSMNLIPLCIWGGLTSLCQVADRYHISRFKKLYKVVEQKALARKMRRLVEGMECELNLRQKQTALCVDHGRLRTRSQEPF